MKTNNAFSLPLSSRGTDWTQGALSLKRPLKLVSEYAGNLWQRGDTHSVRFVASQRVEHHSTWIIGKLSEKLCVPTVFALSYAECQASSLASVSSPWVGWRRTAPHLRLSDGGGRRQSGSRWRPREEIVGLHQGTASSHSSCNSE